MIGEGEILGFEDLYNKIGEQNHSFQAVVDSQKALILTIK